MAKISGPKNLILCRFGFGDQHSTSMDKMEPSVVASGDNVIDQFVDYDKVGDNNDGGQKCCGFYPDRKPCK